MNITQFRNFGELYRAAFAERDPDKKSLLLTEVKKNIEQWEQKLQPRGEKKPLHSESPIAQIA